MTLYQTRLYLLFGIALSVFVFVAGFIATLRALRDGSLLTIPCGLAVAIAAYLTYDYIKRLRSPRPVAILTSLGVTNGFGRTFGWPQITKIYKFTGVLFVRDDSESGWVLRLDPAEVGGAQLSEAISFIKSHAPRHLTERL